MYNDTLFILLFTILLCVIDGIIGFLIYPTRGFLMGFWLGPFGWIIAAIFRSNEETIRELTHISNVLEVVIKNNKSGNAQLCNKLGDLIDNSACIYDVIANQKT